MPENNQYGPEAYKRLELVRKQFQTHAAEKKKQESAIRRRKVFDSLSQNKIKIIRLSAYAVMAVVVVSIIVIAIVE